MQAGAIRIDVSDPSTPAWLMVRIATTQSLTTVPMGTVIDSDDEESPVDVVGCAGPRQDDYTVDARPDRVLIKVDAGADANTRVIRFVATFDNQTVRGAYEVEVP